MPNLKRSKKEMKTDDHAVPEGGNEYPYGLEISLDEEILDKLKQGLMPVGTVIEFTAKSVVKSISQSEYEGDGMNKNMSLQITDMEMVLPKEDDSKVIDRFYGSK